MATKNYLESEAGLHLFISSEYFDQAEKLAKVKDEAKIETQIKEFIAQAPELPALEDVQAEQSDTQDIYRRLQKPIQQLMKKKNQQIILALGHFIVCSEGERLNDIIPILLRALNLLKYSYYSPSYEAFLTALVTILCQVVKYVKDESQSDLIFSLASSILDVYREAPVDSAESALFKITGAVKILRWRSKILDGKIVEGESFYDHTDYSEGQEVLSMLNGTFFTNFDEQKTKREREKRERRQLNEQEKEEKREKKAKEAEVRAEQKALSTEKDKEDKDIKAKEEQEAKEERRKKKERTRKENEKKEREKEAREKERREREKEAKEKERREKEKKEEKKLEVLEKKEKREKEKEMKKEQHEAEKVEKEIAKYEEKKEKEKKKLEKEKEKAEKREKAEKEKADKEKERKEKAEKERIEKEKEREEKEKEKAERREKAEKEKAEKKPKTTDKKDKDQKPGGKEKSPQKSTPRIGTASSSSNTPLIQVVSTEGSEPDLMELKSEDDVLRDSGSTTTLAPPSSSSLSSSSSSTSGTKKSEDGKKATTRSSRSGLAKIKAPRGFGRGLKNLRKSNRTQENKKRASYLQGNTRSGAKVSETDFLVAAVQMATECAHKQVLLTSRVLQFFKEFLIASDPPTKSLSFFDLLLLTPFEASRPSVFKTILSCLIDLVLRINPSDVKNINISSGIVSSVKKAGKSSKMSVLYLLENISKSFLRYGNFFKASLDPWSGSPIQDTIVQTEASPADANALAQVQAVKPFYERLSHIITHFILAIYTLLSNQLNDDESLEKSLRLVLAHLLQSNPEGFSMGQNLMVLGLYHAQAMFFAGSFKDIFAYLENKWIMDAPVGSSIVDFSDRLFTNFVSMGSSGLLSSESLEEQVILLLTSLCNRDELVRDHAKTYLSSLIKEFPNLLWNKRCLTALLDIVEIADVSPEHGPKFYLDARSNPRSRVRVVDPLPSGSEADIQKTITALFDEWLTTCIQLAPNETRDHLRIIGAKLQGPHLIHNGLSRALQQRFSGTVADKVLFNRDKEDPLDDFANFFNEERLESTHIGEVAGMLSVLKGFDNSNKLDKAMLNRLEKHVTSQISLIVRKQLVVDVVTFTNLMYRAAAFLILTKKEKVYQDIIHLLCRAPAVIFTTAAMQVAVAVWRWIMIACPDLQTPLLVEIREAWSFTMESRRGIYANVDGNFELFSAKPAETFSFDDVYPHRLFIEFLRERFIISRQSNEIFAILRKSVSQPHLFNNHVASFGTRFRLVHFCLQYTQMAKIDEALIDQSNFKANVYTTALSWFESPRKWYDPKSLRILIQDRDALMDICRILSGVTGNLGDRSQRTPRGLPRSPSSSFGFESQDDRSIKDKKQFASGEIPLPLPSRKRSLSFSIQRPEVAPEKSPFNPKRNASTNMDQKANLILLLIQNEIERIAAWHNPLQTHDRLPYLKAKKIEKEKLWDKYLSWAWDFSPNLAIQLAARFPVPYLTKRLEGRIADNPGSLVKVPEALPYFITPSAIAEKKPAIKYLRRWLVTNPVSALPFLQKEFSGNAYVMDFALKSLSILTPEALMFFLPQLIQALRFDKEKVYKFLFDIAERNEIVAHQIIWVANAYSEEPDIGKILADLSAKIRDSVPKTNEFVFFEQFTQLSGKLKAVTPSDRKKFLKEQLEIMAKDLAVDADIYLPTNPDSIVVGIDPEKCSPMQSAEKTPILVTFKVNERTKGTLKPEEKEKKKNIKITKACIFKVGDDVRQDILALQLIEVFKRIMENAGLKLFLYPYRVISTAPGCGIIECVPNAKSRDALGKEAKLDLYDYFEHKYGKNTEQFDRARMNFIKSMSAYAVVSFVLQIKDRHNGNILVDTDGHIVHIDFGFLFDSSPGGNAKFERAPFKLSAEMLRLLGGEKATEYFTQFSIQCVKAFLAVREHLDTIVALVGLMLDTKLPCFVPKTIANLKERLAAGKSEKEAVEYMIKRIMESVGSVSTWLYDWFQAKANKIYY